MHGEQGAGEHRNNHHRHSRRHARPHYLPLYNGVSSVELGVPKGKSLAPAHRATEPHRKPIVFYGTSITHGACIRGREWSAPGDSGATLRTAGHQPRLSGNGRMETELARLMAEIDAAVYVIDCLPNIGAQDILEPTKPSIAILRKARSAYADRPG